MLNNALKFSLAICLSACQHNSSDSTARDFSDDTACSLDGMILADFPGPKAQIHYLNGQAPDFFCDTVEMMSIYLAPEQQSKVATIYTQDMGQTDWEQPRGHWIDARTAWYVVGSSQHGSMGKTFASFSQEADAKNFAEKFGGEIVRFGDITADMADLHGGALHDHGM